MVPNKPNSLQNHRNQINCLRSILVKRKNKEVRKQMIEIVSIIIKDLKIEDK
jgi:hypothetical protein